MSKVTSLRLSPARRERLADVLYGQLIEHIMSGSLKEGDRLPSENEICEEFEVSRPVVREALLRLRADGIVYSRQGAGSFIKSRPPSRLTAFARPESVAGYLKTFEPRIVLESEAARLAAIRRSNDDLHALEKAFNALQSAFEQGGAAREADFQFHLVIANATGNTIFAHLLRSTNAEVMGTMTMALGLTSEGSPARRNQVLTEHRNIADAIKAGDGEAASLYMRYHLVQTRNRITDYHKDA